MEPEEEEQRREQKRELESLPQEADTQGCLPAQKKVPARGASELSMGLGNITAKSAGSAPSGLLNACGHVFLDASKTVPARRMLAIAMATKFSHVQAVKNNGYVSNKAVHGWCPSAGGELRFPLAGRGFCRIELSVSQSSIQRGSRFVVPRAPSVVICALPQCASSLPNYCGGGGGADNRFWIMNGPALSSTTL